MQPPPSEPVAKHPPPTAAARRFPQAGLFIAALALFLTATFFALSQAPRPFPLKPDTAWEAFAYPVERNAFARMPHIQSRLNDVFILPDSEDLWTAGDDGLILHSRDAGVTWGPSGLVSGDKPLTTQILRSVFFSNHQHGWVVGDNGTILATADGGKTWQPQASGGTASLTSVQFLADGRRGWAVGGGGKILATANGGQSWQPQVGGVTESLTSVQFLADGLRGWAVGDNGTILATADGGQSWRPQTSGSTKYLSSVQFLPDGLRGWAVCDNGTILATADGGKIWQPQSSGSTAWLHSVQFLADGRRGWAVGNDGTILATADGGKTWQPQISGSTVSLKGVRFLADGRRGWAVGNDGTILATADGGKTWQPQISGSTASLHSVQFLADRLRGWAVGFYGTILATADGGKTWQPQTSSGTAWLYSVWFLADGLRGWAVGFYGTILATADGGKTWQPQASGSKHDLFSVQFLADGLRGWAVGDDGTILSTADGGKTWQPQSSGITAPLYNVQFLAGGLRGWAVGYYGAILATTNGGQSWQLQASDTRASLYSVQFLADAPHGWAVGSGGTILATADGGKTWQPQASSSTAWLYSVQFLADGLRGWAVSGDGTILATADGGKTWQPQTSGSTASLGSVQFLADGQQGWAVGENLTILATSDGGKTWNPIKYRRYPAPWYWLACAFALMLASLGTRHKPPTPETTIADLLASDRPLRPGDPDPLGYAAIAQGVSRFLCNSRTEPPLTVAVSGEWGTGKSSLMNLICADVKKAGFAAVWFNAWHHQKGEQLLASLFANIRAQAIPKLSSRAGLRFRLNLLARRSWRHWLLTLTLAGFSALVLAFLLSDKAHWGQMARLLEAKDGWQDHGLAALASIPLLGGLVSLYRAMQGFGLDPSKLVASMAGGAGKATSLDPGARFKFAGEFDDVTQALAPGRLVIFIDDLDRCSKENVVEVLESINFLVSSGDCFIVLGMAREWVEICVALGFKELAEETLDGNDAEKHRSHRREFARKYLQKLINIEVPVPKLDAADSLRLLPQPLPDTAQPTLLEQSWLGFSAWLSGWRNALVLAGLALFGVTVGLALNARYSSWFDNTTQAIAPPAEKPKLDLPLDGPFGLNAAGGIAIGMSSDAAPAKPEGTELFLRTDKAALEKGIVLGKLGDAELVLKQKPVEFVGPPQPKPESGKPGETPQSKEASGTSASASAYEPGMDNAAHPGWLPLGPGALFGGLALWLLLRSPVKLTEDSATFLDALALWHPWIATACPTPRKVKRFLNRVRYLAMRHRPPEAEALSWLQKTWGKLTRRPPPTKTAAEAGFDERALVALSAIYEFRRDWVADDEKFGLLASGQYPQLFATDGLEDSKALYFLLGPMDKLSTQDWQKARELRGRFLDAVGDGEAA